MYYDIKHLLSTMFQWACSDACNFKSSFLSKIGGQIVCVVFVPSVILSFWKYVWNLILANNSWTVRDRTLIFQRAFLLATSFRGHQHFLPCDLDLEVWPTCIYNKAITLLITFEQWVLKLWYFTWVFYETRLFRGYRQIWPFDLDLGVWLSFWKH